MWKDIDIELTKKVDGDFQDKVNIQAIEESISNIFQTLPGSRRMLPPFASPVWGLLFEQIDNITAQNIGYLLLSSIEKWETRIEVSNLNVEPQEDNNMFIITLTYNIVNDGKSADAGQVFNIILKVV